MIYVVPVESGILCLRSSDQAILGGRNRANKVCAIHQNHAGRPSNRPPPPVDNPVESGTHLLRVIMRLTGPLEIEYPVNLMITGQAGTGARPAGGTRGEAGAGWG